LKNRTFARRSGPSRAAALARTGLSSITVGLALALGTAAGASASTGRVAHVSAGTAGQAAPGAPAGLVATAGAGQVSLSWNASASGATSYDVHAGTTGDFQASTKVATVRGLGYTATGLANGTTYYFWVTAANGAGTSSSSDVASATPAAAAAVVTTAPGAPAGLKATAGQGQVTLSWVAPASSGGSAITSYDIYVGATGAFRGGLPSLVSRGAGTSYVVTGLSAGTAYYFGVAAVNARGAGPVSPVASARLQPAALGAPGNVIAQPGRTRVILLWTAPAAIGGAKVSGYLVYMGTRPGGESGTPVARAPVDDTACAVMGLPGTARYYFKVAAVDTTGLRGALSAEVSAVPWPTATPGPAAPGPAGHRPTGQGTQPTDPAQILAATERQSPAPAPQNTNLTQDHPAPRTPAGLIILLAGVAAAALAGAAGIAVHLRRMRIRPGGPGEPEELDNRPLSGPRYR
jgi:titin